MPHQRARVRPGTRAHVWPQVSSLPLIIGQVLSAWWSGAARCGAAGRGMAQHGVVAQGLPAFKLSR
eukprot:9287530-Alexandrium_andersonii.AAC.1